MSDSAGRRGSHRPGDPGGPGSTGGAGEPDDPERAYRVAREIALRKLETRDRTRAELADALRARATPETVVEAVLDRLGDVGLVDDTRFAISWVESRQRTRRLAGRALTAELRRHGVADAVAASAVGGIDPAAEEHAAFQLARERVARSSGLAQEVLTRRIVGQLSRRGYDGALSFRAVRAALDQSGRPASDHTDGSDETDDVGGRASAGEEGTG